MKYSNLLKKWPLTFSLVCIQPALVDASSFSFEDLEQWITNEKPKEIEEVFSILPEDFKHAVLVHDSQSIQESSPENPRVLLFGDGAELVLSFNGHPNQRGYQGLELVQFRTDTAKFEYREIKFPGKNSDASSTPVISEANPRVCQNCHRGPDVRPNWDPFKHWPGAYGGLRFPNWTDWESQNLAKFVASASSHSRYRNLLENGKLKTNPMYENVHLAAYLSELNFKRVARLMKSHPKFDQYKFLLALNFLTDVCGNEKFAEAWPNSALFENHRDFKTRRKERGRNAGRVEQVEWLNRIYEPYGILTYTWSMEFRQDTDSPVTNRFSSAIDDSIQVAAHLAQIDPGLKALLNPRLVPWANGDKNFKWLTVSPTVAECEHLSEQSRLALSAVKFP